MTLLAWLAWALVVLALLRAYSNRLRRRSFDRHADEAMAVVNEFTEPGSPSWLICAHPDLAQLDAELDDYYDEAFHQLETDRGGLT